MKGLILLVLATVPGRLSAQGGLPTTAADSLALWGVVLRAAVEHGLRTSYGAPRPRLVCVAVHRGRPVVSPSNAFFDPPVGVLSTLAQIDSVIVRPMSACRVDLRNLSRDTPLVIDTLSGQRGIKVSASPPALVADGSFTVVLGYYEHGLSSAEWTCTGRRRDATWEIMTCRMDRIS